MITAEQTMRDIVLEHNGTAEVLEKYGLDFCCQGARSLEDACRTRNLDTETVLEELKASFVDEAGFDRYQKWDLSFLCDYIVNHHHTYVKESMPMIREHLTKVIGVYSLRYPAVKDVGMIFANVCQELELHMMKEENILFPYITELNMAQKLGLQRPTAVFGTVSNPIAMMQSEHEQAGAAMEKIRELLNDYAPPEDACTTMRLTYNELSAFEHDLHRHVFLENAILFPRAQKLERELINS